MPSGAYDAQQVSLFTDPASHRLALAARSKPPSGRLVRARTERQAAAPPSSVMKSRRLMSNMALPPGPTDPCNQLAARSADLIRRMSFENPLWGATKIHGRTAQTHADLAHLVPFRTAAFPFSDDVLHRIGLSLEWLPPSTRGNAHRCTIGMGTVCDDPDSDNETPLRLAPYDRRCLN